MKKLHHALYAVLNASEPDSSDRRIANYLIENIYKKEHFGIQDVADACFVSKSSVSRFCRRIGYADFLAMSQSIKYVQMRTCKRFDEYLDLLVDAMAGACCPARLWRSSTCRLTACRTARTSSTS